MLRCDSSFSFHDIEQLAMRAKVLTTIATARCEHGKSRFASCRECEGGYVQDTHTFANVKRSPASYMGELALAVSDDGCAVIYISDAWQRKLTALELKEEQEEDQA